MLLCYTCGSSYCLSCAGLVHEGNCTLITQEDKAIIDRLDATLVEAGDGLENFI